MDADWKGIVAGIGAAFLFIQTFYDRKRRMEREARRDERDQDLGTKADVVTAEHKVIESKIDSVHELIDGRGGVIDDLERIKEKLE
jgi:hypothetical protein